jgi:antirestriction protein ArdC
VSKDIYEIITARFIDQLKRGTVPWQKPWMGVQNIVSKKPYRGINSLILGGSDFQSPYWLTFKQAQQTSPESFSVTDQSKGTVSHHKGSLSTPHAAQAAFNSHPAKSKPSSSKPDNTNS